jgi:hypothetical protein
VLPPDGFVAEGVLVVPVVLVVVVVVEVLFLLLPPQPTMAVRERASTAIAARAFT